MTIAVLPGVYIFRSVASNLVLEPLGEDGASESVGSTAFRPDYDAQKWNLAPIESYSDGVDKDTYTIKNVADGTYLGVNSQEGVVVQALNNAQPQAWEIRPSLGGGMGKYCLVAAGTDLGVDAQDAPVATPISAEDRPTQQWLLEPTFSGIYHIINFASKTFLDLQSASAKPRTPIFGWEGRRGKNQQWVFLPKIDSPDSFAVMCVASETFLSAKGFKSWTKAESALEPTEFVLRNTGKGGAFFIEEKSTGLVLDLAYGSTKNGASIMFCGKNKYNQQNWILEPMAGDLFKLSKLSAPADNPVEPGKYDPVESVILEPACYTCGATSCQIHSPAPILCYACSMPNCPKFMGPPTPFFNLTPIQVKPTGSRKPKPTPTPTPTVLKPFVPGYFL